jgi:hypothetical protein
MSAIENLTLTEIETKRFETLKRQIRDWWKDRIKIGEALRQIRDSKLYRATHKTFEAFCIAEFEIKEAQAYRLIAAADVKESLKGSPVGEKITNEGQARALAVVPPQERESVLKEVSEKGPVTAKAIVEAVKHREQVKEPEKPTTPVERKDKTGYVIPESILFDWDRAAESSKRLLSAISDARSELKHALAEKDVIFAEVTNTTIADFDNAYTSIKCVVPYAVCTSCQGHQRKKCSLCRGRGFISEFSWRSHVPSEIKALRGGK